jgi:putative nucleotidyltransferase with HDIG domain
MSAKALRTTAAPFDRRRTLAAIHAAAAELGVDLLWDAPTDPDPAKQTEVVEAVGEPEADADGDRVAVPLPVAERAAEQIGVDSLLVRVGAYYHDVGKLRRPYYFVENQFDGDNIHHRLSPEASATAIIDHVIHGVELAREYRLPVAVQAFIVEHHGTRLAGFFYREALKVAGADTVDERAFRYPGPRPQIHIQRQILLAHQEPANHPDQNHAEKRNHPEYRRNSATSG